ncbi:hypothetical protein MNBD_NITROSPINAE02-850, partial [hydrothermal vent metagenome]
EVSSISSSIAAATEEQSASINEISHSTSTASNSATAISKDVSTVTKDINIVLQNFDKTEKTTRDTSGSVSEVVTNSEIVAVMATRLQKIIGQFKV